MKTLRLLPVILLLGACAHNVEREGVVTGQAATVAPNTQPAKPLDPAGAYEFSTVVDGQTVTGTLHIEGTSGSYKGRIVTNAFPEIPVTDASVDGNVINVKASMPDGELLIRMAMEGSNFKGNWTLGAGSGEFNGKKLAK